MTDLIQAKLNAFIGDFHFCCFTIFPTWGEIYPWRKLVMRTEWKKKWKEKAVQRKTEQFSDESLGDVTTTMTGNKRVTPVDSKIPSSPKSGLGQSKKNWRRLDWLLLLLSVTSFLPMCCFTRKKICSHCQRKKKKICLTPPHFLNHMKATQVLLFCYLKLHFKC